MKNRWLHREMGAALVALALAVPSVINGAAWAADWQHPLIQPLLSTTPLAAGRYVALGGGQVLINGGDYAGGHGSAILFDAATAQQLRVFANPQPYVYADFGWAVDLSGHTALIGAPAGNATPLYADDSGTAYLFDTATGQQLRKLTASDAQRGARFGSAVSLSNDWALVGSPYLNNMAGAAYLFNPRTGVQLAEFSVAPTSLRDWFGSSLAVSGNTAVIGAPGGFSTSTGAAYVYDLSTHMQIAALTAPDGVQGSRFGLDVAIDGNLILVGATEELGPYGYGTTGGAYLFDTAGHFLRKLTPTGGAIGDQFGTSVALQGNLAFVGSRPDSPVQDAGAVYVFDVPTGQQLARFALDAPATNTNFGISMDVEGSLAVVGTSGRGAYLATAVPLPSAVWAGAGLLLALGLCRHRRRSGLCR